MIYLMYKSAKFGLGLVLVLVLPTYLPTYKLCFRPMWCSVINLIVLNCKVSHEKSSSASFFTTAKVTSQILLDQASRDKPYLNWAFERIKNPGGEHKDLPL